MRDEKEERKKEARSNVHVLMRDEKEGKHKQDQTNNKAKYHSTPKAVTFPKKNELPRVGLEPTALQSRQSALPLSAYMLLRE